MKIKVDENLPLQIAEILNSRGHDAHTVRDEQLEGGSDDAIWSAAQRESRLLLTQDLDFSNTQKLIPGTHSGILLVRLRHPSRRAFVQRIDDLFGTEDVESWLGCFVVATDSKVRVVRPAQ